MENTGKAKMLIVVQDFKDKQGVQHRKGDQFQAGNEQEAQEYIRQGNAREAEQQQQK